jgi:hypothetical protein
MTEPFRFYRQSTLVELLARRARNLEELLAGVRDVPASSIYYHTHRFLDQRRTDSPEPPNDFAYWAVHALSRYNLGERLASINAVAFPTIEDLRDGLRVVLEGFLQDEIVCAGRCQEGDEFHFMASRTFVRPTPFEARDLREFADLVRTIPAESLSFHVFEARLRFPDGEFGFAPWFEAAGRPELARTFARIDPYPTTLESLRKRIVDMVNAHA